MAKILIIYHSQSGNTKKLAKAVAFGAKKKGAQVFLKRASEATTKDFFNCDAIAIGSPNYFSYMAGMVKDFFDRVYVSAIDKVENKPYVIFVTHGTGGGTPVIENIEHICRIFKLKKAAEPLTVYSEPRKADLKKAEALGEKFASQIP